MEDHESHSEDDECFVEDDNEYTATESGMEPEVGLSDTATRYDRNYTESHSSLKDKGVLCPEYDSLGPPTEVCEYCNAIFWKEERVNKNHVKDAPLFSMCCNKGLISLPPSNSTPSYLLTLHNDKVMGPRFRRSIRIYNSMLSFTSMGGNIDYSINRSRGPYIFRLNGVTYHRFGSLIPNEGEDPKFCQLYIYDTQNEVENRIGSMKIHDSDQVDTVVLDGLVKMLDDSNKLVKFFRKAGERFNEENVVDLKIILKSSRSESGRENHNFPSNEVGGLIVTNNNYTCGQRDIVIETTSGKLKRISEVHPKMMALQYPLLFPYGEDGYHDEIYYKQVGPNRRKKREKVSMREFYSYQLQVRKNQGNIFYTLIL